MKRCFSILACALSLNVFSQSICGTAAENGSVTLTAPAGKVFTTVTFASYGTPSGSCGSFTTGSCHAANSKTIVENALLGHNTATIAATNGVFGDPCNGTVKSLYIEAAYSSTLPLHLLSFSCISNGRSVILQWQTTNEINTRAFDVERSSDAVSFSAIGSVTAANTNGRNFYSYTDNSITQQSSFYRLKMTNRDGSFTYSHIIKTAAGSSTDNLSVFPNPVTNYVSVSGLNATGYLEITTLHGESLKRITITGRAQTVNMADYPAGIYILKYTTGKNILYQKIVKQ